MFNYLTQHRAIAFLVSTAYFLGLIYFHDAATVAADWLKYKLTLPWYNAVLLISGTGLAVYLAVRLWRVLRKKAGSVMHYARLLLTFALMILSTLTMMVVNMEAIHFIQYAFMAILILPLVRRYSDAFVLATIFGIADEVYQYLVLNPTFKYFDFNDIILNMLGAGAGLLVIAIIGFEEIKAPPKWYLSSAFLFSGFIILLGIILSMQQYVTFFPVAETYEGGHWFSLYRENLPEEFWTYLYGNRYYHILRPWEGIGVMAALTLLYSVNGTWNNSKFTFKS